MESPLQNNCLLAVFYSEAYPTWKMLTSGWTSLVDFNLSLSLVDAAPEIRLHSSTARISRENSCCIVLQSSYVYAPWQLSCQFGNGKRLYYKRGHDRSSPSKSFWLQSRDQFIDKSWFYCQGKFPVLSRVCYLCSFKPLLFWVIRYCFKLILCNYA